MAYSTPEMVRQALVPTSDGSLPANATNTAADLSDDQLEDAIAEADSLINGYIGGYYQVPVDAQQLANTPIPYWSRNIAAYVATLTYRGSMDFTDTDPIFRRYKDTLANLNAVASNKMRLQISDNVQDNAGEGAGAPFNPYIGDLWTPDDFDLQPEGYPWWNRW